MGGGTLKLLLDSVILIDHLNGIDVATRFLAESHPDAVVSVITRAEVLAGFASASRATPAVALLDAFATLGIDRTTADLAAELRREHHWKLPDAFQAALALRNGLQLATRNTKDFPPKRHDFVTIPYRC